MVLAGVGRTLVMDAVEVIGDRFVRQPSAAPSTVGGQALDLERGSQRWRRAWRMASPERWAWKWARRWWEGTGSSGRYAARRGAR